MQKRAATTPPPVSIDTGGHRAKVLARRDALVLEHLERVHGVARSVARTLPPSFDLEDLIAAGTVALCEVALRFRPKKHGNAPFWSFARPRVYGAIVDSVRGRRYAENTRPGLDALLSGMEDGEGGGESQAMNEAATPPVVEQQIDARRLAIRVMEAISWLSNEERAVLQVYYGAEEPTLPEVADRLGVKTWKVQELHLSAIASLRARLKAAA